MRGAEPTFQGRAVTSDCFDADLFEELKSSVYQSTSPVTRL